MMFSFFGHMVKVLKNYHPNIKFTHEFNKESIASLALKVTTDLHIKSTDKHQYLLMMISIQCCYPPTSSKAVT